MTQVTIGAARALTEQLNDPTYADHAIGVLRQWLAEEKGGALAFDDDAKVVLRTHVNALTHGLPLR
jgi:hypothetical protein